MPDAGAAKSKSNNYDFDILVVGGDWLVSTPYTVSGKWAFR